MYLEKFISNEVSFEQKGKKGNPCAVNCFYTLFIFTTKCEVLWIVFSVFDFDTSLKLPNVLLGSFYLIAKNFTLIIDIYMKESRSYIYALIKSSVRFIQCIVAC